MKKQRQEIGCIICPNEADIFIHGTPYCEKCYLQIQNDSWRDEIRRNVEALDYCKSADSIIDKVCSINNLERADLMVKTRRGEVIEARHMCMHLIYSKFAEFSRKKTAMVFGQSAHATSTNASKQIENRIATSKSFREKYQELLR
jgi:chromosomal replication initiation ATPase DnaA